jgi:hypothetical protein
LGTSSGNKKSREKIHHKTSKNLIFSLFVVFFLIKKSSGKPKGFFPPRIPGEN